MTTPTPSGGASSGDAPDDGDASEAEVDHDQYADIDVFTTPYDLVKSPVSHHVIEVLMEMMGGETTAEELEEKIAALLTPERPVEILP